MGRSICKSMDLQRQLNKSCNKSSMADSNHAASIEVIAPLDVLFSIFSILFLIAFRGYFAKLERMDEFLNNRIDRF